MARAQSTTPKPKKQFSDIFAKYKHYDPKVEGFGNPQEWAETFHARMGFEEAETILHGQEDSPRTILGVGARATWEEIKKAYRAMAMRFHPDQARNNGLDPKVAEEQFKKIEAALTYLEKEFGK
jgi:DnaJ-domain-containing protein 1